MDGIPHRAVVVLAVIICAVMLASCAGSQTEVGSQSPAATGLTGATSETGGTPQPEPLPTPLTGNVHHGERYFGVYLAAAPFGAPELDTAVEQLAGFGVEAFPGDIGCDQGAAPQLGVSNDVAAVAIYFVRRPDAQAWVDALDPPPLGIAMVRTFCAD